MLWAEYVTNEVLWSRGATKNLLLTEAAEIFGTHEKKFMKHIEAKEHNELST